MDRLLLSNMLDVITALVCLFITIRVFLVYPNVRSPRLLVLGLSMGILTLGAIADLVSSNLASLEAHTDWFLYLGETAALLCILLSLVSDANAYLERLIRVQVFATVLLVGLLLISIVLPDIPNVGVREIVGSTRYIVCTGISFFYITGFMKKQSRFGILMALCFLLLAAGYLMDMQQYIMPVREALFDSVGDFSRLAGWLTLLIAVLIG